jgi:hypothetical protein
MTIRGVSHSSLEGIADIRGEIDSRGTFIETGGNIAHGRWSYGSTQVIGMHSMYMYMTALNLVSQYPLILKGMTLYIVGACMLLPKTYSHYSLKILYLMGSI